MVAWCWPGTGVLAWDAELLRRVTSTRHPDRKLVVDRDWSGLGEGMLHVLNGIFKAVAVSIPVTQVGGGID